MAGKRLYLVFEVRSIGMFGEGYAVAWLLLSQAGQELYNGFCHCSPEGVKGDKQTRARAVRQSAAWSKPLASEPAKVREYFCSVVARYQHLADLAAYDPFPVEAMFLKACMDESPDQGRGFPALVDIKSVMLGAGRAVDPAFVPGDESPQDAVKRHAQLLLEAIR